MDTSGNNSSSAAGGKGGPKPIYIDQISLDTLMTGLTDAKARGDESQALDIIGQLEGANVSQEQAKNISSKLKPFIGRLEKSELKDRGDKLIRKLQSTGRTFSELTAQLGDKARQITTTAINQSQNPNYGMRDLRQTSVYFAELAQEIGQVGKLYDEIAKARQANNIAELDKLEAEAERRKSALEVAIEAQSAARKSTALKRMLANQLRPDEYFEIEAQTDRELDRRIQKPEQTMEDKAAVAYLQKLKKYVEEWKELTPSWQGVALTSAAVAMTGPAAGGIGAMMGSSVVGSGVAGSGVAGSGVAGSGVVSTPGAFARLFASAAFRGSLQAGSVIGLATLLALYGPDAFRWSQAVYETLSDQLGDLSNYIAGIWRPQRENLSLLSGISDHGPTEYNAYTPEDYQRMTANLNAALTPAQREELRDAERVADTLPDIETGLASGTLTGREILDAAANNNQEAQAVVASALDNLGSRAPSRANTPAGSQYEGFGLGGRRKRRSTKRRRGTKRRRNTKRRGTRKRQRRYTKRRRGLRRR